MPQQPVMKNSITWLGHDSFKIVGGGKVIYIDPFQLAAPQEPADLLLITHEHFDHCSPKDFEGLMQPSTTTIAAASCDPKLFTGKVIMVKPGERHEIDGVIVETVPAYNIGKSFHPREDERVGFVLTIEGERIYHSGDTDNIPEMRELRNIDVALVPVSGTYVMTAEEAAEAVNSFQPKLAIPMHYGSIIGSGDDAKQFKESAKVQVEILEQA